MKLIMENFKRFLRENASPIKKLRIFDFDETIAFTQSSVKVITATGGRLTLPTQEEFDRFIASEMSRLSQMGHRFEFDPIPALVEIGYEFDFSDFSRVIDPRENGQVTKIIRAVVEANKMDPTREVYVMTARADDARGSIKKYLSSLGFGPDDFTDVITLTGGSKREAIANIIEKHKGENGHTTIESVHFFDDSEKNLKDVALLRNDYPHIKDIRIKHVIEDKITSLEEGGIPRPGEEYDQLENILTPEFVQAYFQNGGGDEGLAFALRKITDPNNQTIAWGSKDEIVRRLGMNPWDRY